MNPADKLIVLAHLANFSIVVYIFVATIIAGTYEPIHQLITVIGLIFSVIVNIIGVLITFRKNRGTV